MTVSTYSTSGIKSATSASLPKSVFAVEIKNHQLLKEAYLAYLANGRQNLAKSLSRGEVRGGGKKPWRQKGTGRARFGSSRNPIWRGGGVAFGPTGIENFGKKINLKAKRQALRQALTLAAQDNKISVIEKIEFNGLVKDTVKLLKKIEANRNTLIVVDKIDESAMLATGNIESLKVVLARSLNVFDIMNAENILISKTSLGIIDKWLGGDK